MITQVRLQELLSYDPETGIFRWKVDRNGNAKKGEVAGSIASDGYRAIRIDGRHYFAHRLAWFFVHGMWPADQIDHLNGRRADNRLANLREATNRENQQNLRRARSGSRSGLLGVSWHGQKGRWRAEIRYNGKPVDPLGYLPAR